MLDSRGERLGSIKVQLTSNYILKYASKVAVITIQVVNDRTENRNVITMVTIEVLLHIQGRFYDFSSV